MPVASRIERVTDAAKLSATNGSSQSTVAGSEKVPLLGVRVSRVVVVEQHHVLAHPQRGEARGLGRARGLAERRRPGAASDPDRREPDLHTYIGRRSFSASQPRATR